MTDEQQINSLNGEIAGLTGKCEALEQDKENLERTLEENREELERLKDINCAMENELYNNELNMTLLCKEIDRLKAEIETLSRDYVVRAYDQLMAENAKLKKQVKKVRKETAVKEFAEKLKETVFDYLGVKTIEEADKLSLLDSTLTYDVVTDRIDELLEEYEK